MPGNCVFGRGTVDGRPVVIAGDDFTLRGGSADASIKGKPKMSEEIATQFRMPIIRLIEGSGGGGSVKTIETTGRANLPGGLTETTSFDLVANQMAQVPVVGLGLGSVAGPGRGAAGRRALFGDGEGNRGGVRRRPAGGGTAGRTAHRNKNSAAGRSSCAAAPSITRSIPKTRPSRRARRFLSYLPGSIRRRAAAGAADGTTRTGATNR